MLLNEKKFSKKRLLILCAYATCMLSISSLAYALNADDTKQPLTMKSLNVLIKPATLQATITPEVVDSINQTRSDEHARTQMIAALKRMEKYKILISAELKNKQMPANLLAVPLVESGYRAMDESLNPALAAGIWQIIPSTAKELGLAVNDKLDDRLDPELSTKAALTLLNTFYTKYHDWKLAVLAYEYGDKEIDRLISQTGSHDAWALARSPSAPKDLKKFLATFDAAVIMINNPSLVTRLG